MCSRNISVALRLTEAHPTNTARSAERYTEGNLAVIISATVRIAIVWQVQGFLGLRRGASKTSFLMGGPGCVTCKLFV